MKYSCGHEMNGPSMKVDFPCIKCRKQILVDKIRDEGVLSLTLSESEDHELITGIPVLDLIQPEDAYDIPNYRGCGF